MSNRRVEVFTAGCPVCEPVVQMVREMACPECEVIINDVTGSGAEAARSYGLKTLPAVVVDGTLVSCCQTSGPNREELARAGIGQSS